MANTAVQTATPAGSAGTRQPWDLPAKGIIAANVALVLVATLLLDVNLFNRGSITTLTPVIGVMALIALGQAFVIGTGGIDLSIPSTVTLVGVIILKSAAGSNDALLQALLTCLAAVVVIGLVNGFLVEVLRLNALVVTLATGQLTAGVTRMYRGQTLAVTRVPDRLSEVARSSIGDVSLILVVAVLVGVGAVFLAGQITTPDLTLGSPYLLTSVVAVVLGGASIAGGRVKVAATVLGATFIVLLEHVFRVKGFSSGVGLLVEGLVLSVGLALVASTKNVRWLSFRTSAVDTPDGPSALGVTNSQNSQE